MIGGKISNKRSMTSLNVIEHENQPNNKSNVHDSSYLEDQLLYGQTLEFQYLTETGTLNSGQSFGELALMHRNKKYKRAATVLSKGVTHIAVLSKADFQRVYLGQIEKGIDKMIDFLRQFRICQDVSRPALTQLLYYLKEKNYRRRDMLFKEGDPSEGVYFIKDGEFEVSYNKFR